MNRINKYNTKSPFGLLFDEIFNKGISDFMGADQTASIPSVNILHNSDGYTVQVAAPGLKKTDFKVALEKDQLTVCTNKESSSLEEGTKYVRREFGYQNFKRSFTINEDIDRESITATYENGILQISLKKLPNDVVNEIKRIEIE